MFRARHRRHGFTLIELLIVVVIIGVLATIAIPRFASTKGKAYTATLKSDIRNLATAQEGYFYESSSYTNNLVTLNFTPSTGVVINIPEATTTGWSAVATAPGVSPSTCAIFFGNAAAVPPAVSPGIIACQ